jgi:hypothetical protein
LRGILAAIVVEVSMSPPRLLLVLALATAAAGCDDAALGTCGGPNQACCDTACSTGLFCVSGICSGPGKSPIDLTYRTKVDVLFMVDDSPSMEAMADELRRKFPQFFSVFADLAKKGFYADLHIGVVTSDLGAGATGAPGCARGGGGRMGRFQAIGKAAPPGCQRPIGADYVQYSFAPTGDGPSNLPPGQDLLATFTCMASVGSTGCGMEHQLESVYQALHNPPAGFLRDDALLAVVFVTNEDDCSAPFDTDLFDETKVDQYGYFDSYRCTRFGIVHGTPPSLFPYSDSGGPLTMNASAPNPNGAGPGKLWDLGRYLDWFTKPASAGGIKGDPADIVLVAIDAPADPAAVILSDPNTPSGAYPRCAGPIDEKSRPPCVPVLDHSCINVNKPQFFGDPSIRINSLINAAAHHSVSSICDDDYSGALQNLGNQIASQLGLGCIGSKLPSDPQSPGQYLSNCIVTDVTQANGTSSTFNIPKCTAPPSSWPCWRVETKPGCAGRSPQGLGLTIDRNGQPTPPNADIRASCNTLSQ